jgi:hypothetical protein
MGTRLGLTAVSVVTLVLSIRGLAVAPVKGISLAALGAYQTGLFDEGAVEIAAYDPITRRVFMTFAERPEIRAVDISNPAHPSLALVIDISPWGLRATSVATHDAVLAVAVPAADETEPGHVVFFTTHGAFLRAVTVGALPDMVTFTPNGAMVLTANEGQPRPNYTFDPEGSVSIIDVRGGVASLTQADVATAGFGAFNDAVLDPSIRIFGPGSTVAQDLEPEYIAVSHNSQTAWATLQENNALAVIDLKSKQVTSLVPLGAKDHNRPGFGLDGSTDDRAIGIRPWPVRGLYMPDAIAAYSVRGQTLLVTANEGDVREYDGLNAPAGGGESEAVEIEDVLLDPIAFPGALAAQLRHRTQGIGRLKVSAFSGDTDGDGDFDELYAFGARSFSIWTAGGALVWDSGDALERITAAAHPANFNASNTNNTLDNRSDDKGPEPEGIAVHKLFGRDYAFVALERIGGVVVYDISDPTSPVFVQYINTRNFGAAPGTLASGDQGAEGIRVITEDESPTRRPLLAVSNEVSGSLRLFSVAQVR